MNFVKFRVISGFELFALAIDAAAPGSHPSPHGLYSGSRKSDPLRASFEDRPKTDGCP